MNEQEAKTDGADLGSAVVSDHENLTSAQLLDRLNAAEYEGSELMGVLETLEDIFASARSLPMSALVLVNRAQVQELIQAARGAMPADIAAANSIVAGGAAVINKAQQEASSKIQAAKEESERMLADAHAQAERLVQDQRIVVMAEERANQIIEEANKRAEEISQGADSYCDKQLADLLAEFEKYVSQAKAGRKVLAQRAKHQPEGEKNPVTGEESNGVEN